MSRDLHVPYVSRDDRLAAATTLDATRALHGEARIEARELLLRAAADPSLRTVGDVLDALRNATPAQRRTLLLDLRRSAGLEPVQVLASRLPRPAARVGKRHQTCGEPGCLNRPMTVDGADALSDARQWWCGLHVAGHEGDLEPARPRLAYGPSGAIVDLAEQEAEQVKAEREAARQAKRRAEQQAEREAEAAEAAARQHTLRAQLERETPPGMPHG